MGKTPNMKMLRDDPVSRHPGSDRPPKRRLSPDDEGEDRGKKGAVAGKGTPDGNGNQQAKTPTSHKRRSLSFAPANSWDDSSDEESTQDVHSSLVEKRPRPEEKVETAKKMDKNVAAVLMIKSALKATPPLKSVLKATPPLKSVLKATPPLKSVLKTTPRVSTADKVALVSHPSSLGMPVPAAKGKRVSFETVVKIVEFDPRSSTPAEIPFAITQSTSLPKDLPAQDGRKVLLPKGGFAPALQTNGEEIGGTPKQPLRSSATPDEIPFAITPSTSLPKDLPAQDGRKVLLRKGRFAPALQTNGEEIGGTPKQPPRSSTPDEIPFARTLSTSLPKHLPAQDGRKVLLQKGGIAPALQTNGEEIGGAPEQPAGTFRTTITEGSDGERQAAATTTKQRLGRDEVASKGDVRSNLREEKSRHSTITTTPTATTTKQRRGRDEVASKGAVRSNLMEERWRNFTVPPTRKYAPWERIQLLQLHGFNSRPRYSKIRCFEKSPLLASVLYARRGTRRRMTPVRHGMPASVGLLGERPEETLAEKAYSCLQKSLEDCPTVCDRIVGREDQVNAIRSSLIGILEREDGPRCGIIEVRGTPGSGISSILRDIFYNEEVELPTHRFGILWDVRDHALRFLADQVMPGGKLKWSYIAMREENLRDIIMTDFECAFRPKFVGPEDTGLSLPGVVVVKLVDHEPGSDILRMLFDLAFKKYELIFIVINVEHWHKTLLADALRLNEREGCEVPVISHDVKPYTAEELSDILCKRVTDKLEESFEILPPDMIRRSCSYVARCCGDIRHAMQFCQEAVSRCEKAYMDATRVRNADDKDGPVLLERVGEDVILCQVSSETRSTFEPLIKCDDRSHPFDDVFRVVKRGVFKLLQRACSGGEITLSKAFEILISYSQSSRHFREWNKETIAGSIEVKKPGMDVRAATQLLLQYHEEGLICLTSELPTETPFACRSNVEVKVSIHPDAKSKLAAEAAMLKAKEPEDPVAPPPLPPVEREYSGRRLRSLTRRSYAEAKDAEDGDSKDGDAA